MRDDQQPRTAMHPAMTMDPRAMALDPDLALVATFKYEPRKNEAKSLAEGRDVYDDIEVCEIRKPGSRDWQAYPAHERSHWKGDMFTGGQEEVTYADRFWRQYQQFKSKQQQTKSGTPLALVDFLSEGKVRELQALNIYTLEALAGMDGQELKNLGTNGRELKNKAMAYIDNAKAAAPAKQLEAQLEQQKMRLQILEEDNVALKRRSATKPFEAMTGEQLVHYITAVTGNAPIGTLPVAQLIEMAADVSKGAPAS